MHQQQWQYIQPITESQMEGNIDSRPIITLVLMSFVVAMFVIGIISSARLVKALEDEEDNKNRP